VEAKQKDVKNSELCSLLIEFRQQFSWTVTVRESNAANHTSHGLECSRDLSWLEVIFCTPL